MASIVSLLEGLTLWHWMGIGILLLCVEVAVGTFDLLWIGIAAFATALYALVMPGDPGAWQGQLVFFGVVAAALVVLGRTVFSGMREIVSSHPNLNDRMTAMIGKHGQATKAFERGSGKIRIGDTEWLATVEAGPLDGAAPIGAGDEVVVVAAQGTSLMVRPV